MKIYHFFLCAFLTFTMCEVCAQGTKKAKVTKPKVQQQNNFSLKPCDGLNIVLEKVERFGDNAVVYFNITNNTKTDIETTFGDIVYRNTRYKHSAYDENGNSYECYVYFGNKRGSYGVKLPVGVKIKGTFVIYNVPESASTIKKMQITGFHTDNKPQNFFRYSYADLPIETVKNTNISNMTCNLPLINVNFNGTTNVGKNKVLLFTITNTGVKSENLNLGRISAYDIDGNEYNGTEGTLGKYKWRWLEPHMVSSLPLNIPVKATIIIKDAANVSNFSIIRIPIGGNGNTGEGAYKIEIRNLKCETKY